MTDIEFVKKVQQIQYKMLKIVAEICEKNDIIFYLAYGTLLGSVRHRGFIPWDDDLDIMLPRKDYDRLMIALEKELPDEYWVQNYNTDSQYWQPYAKVRDKRTIYKERGQEKMDDDKCGVWLDIFPLEYCDASRKWSLDLRKYLVKIISFSLRRREFNFKYSSFSRRYVPVLIIMELFSKKSLKRIQERLLRTVKQEKARYLVDITAGYALEKTVYPLEWFGENAKLQFGDEYYTVPCKYQEVLTLIYGNYMELPPEDKRKGHNIGDFSKIVI